MFMLVLYLCFWKPCITVELVSGMSVAVWVTFQRKYAIAVVCMV